MPSVIKLFKLLKLLLNSSLLALFKNNKIVQVRPTPTHTHLTHMHPSKLLKCINFILRPNRGPVVDLVVLSGTNYSFI